MAQLTIYLDDETRRRIERAASRASTSVSRWVKHKLEDALERQWPEGYFEQFGRLADSDLERPAQPEERNDVAREPLHE